MLSKTGIFSFFKQVQAEVRKVVWPSRREVLISSIMVFVLVLLAATFFFIVDQVFAFGAGKGILYLVNFFR